MRPKKEAILRGILNRILQNTARTIPGASTVRVFLHRVRGVRIGRKSWIGYDVVFDTSVPRLIRIGNNVIINMRTTLIAHFREQEGITIEDDAFLGPGVIVLPGVNIGKGAVITAGSVVTRSVPEMTVVQGNPAVPIARNTAPLRMNTSYRSFLLGMRPVRRIEKQSGASK